MSEQSLSHRVAAGEYDEVLGRVYTAEALPAVRERILTAIGHYISFYGESDQLVVVSAPGRTEIGGNHTDHNGGHVLAGAVSLDILAVAAPAVGNRVAFKSKGFAQNLVDLNVLVPQQEEAGSSSGLIRGIAAELKQRGYRIGGFNAYGDSLVQRGSGLSSSGAFEVLVCQLFSHLFNEGRLPAQDAAVIGSRAENLFFGKPCGLTDIMASSMGGFLSMDFADRENPTVAPVDFDFGATGHSLCIVDTKSSYQSLTAHYAAIPRDMHSVAQVLGQELLGQCDREEFYRLAPQIRAACGDLAFLRAAHFFEDDLRAVGEAQALAAGDFSRFLALVNQSGRSSFMYLQNGYLTADPRVQPLTVALCLSQRLLGERGAFRLHGGGYAGTIQAFVPNDLLPTYREGIEAVFGPESCKVLTIRSEGGVRLI